MRVAEQELVVHLFAHATGPFRDEAAELVRHVWARCRDELGMSEPVRRLGLPVEPPDVPAEGVLAARQRPDRSAQALLRLRHDVFGLSLLLGPTADWPDLELTAATVVTAPTPAILGIAWLYLGKTADDDMEALPGLVGVAGGWWRQGRVLGSDLTVWDTSGHSDTHAERRLVVLAPPGRDNDLSVWTWTDGDAELPPLAGYLTHIAKVRYELRVLASLPSRTELAERVTGALSRVRDHGGLTVADHDELRALRFDIGRQTSMLRDLRRTVEIAASNAHAVADPYLGPTTGAGDPFSEDAALAAHALDVVDDELAYLATSAEDTRMVTELYPAPARRSRALPTAPTVGIITALPEEFAAMRMMVDDERRRDVDGDPAIYFLGSVPSVGQDRSHQVVVTQLGENANNAASNGCTNLIRSFPTIGYVLMVGVAAGIPAPTAPARHVRLGDIVVASWGVIDYDHVVDTPEGVSLRQSHPRPSPRFGHVAKLLRAEEILGSRPWDAYIDAAVSASPVFARPPANTDVVRDMDDATLPHPDPALSQHPPGRSKVHHGRVGSADRSLRDASKRDELAARYDLRAIEMEGTGVGKSSFANGLEWHMVRGVSDYADHHVGHGWRHHAALVAAAYAKALLCACGPLAPRPVPEEAPPWDDVRMG